MFCFSRKSPNVSVLGIAVKNKYNPLKFRRDLPKHFRLYIGYDTCAFCCRPIKFPSLCKGNRQGRIKPTWGPGWLWILWRTFLHILLQNYAIKVIVNLFIWHPPMAFRSVGESSMWQYKYKSWYWLTDPSKHALSGAILYLKYKKFYFALNIVAPWLQPSQLPPFLIRLGIGVFLRSSHGQLPSTLCVEYTVVYGPGLKSLPPFDTLFLQSSHKASPFLHRLQIKIHANAWRPNLGTADRYYNHQLNNDAFFPIT